MNREQLELDVHHTLSVLGLCKTHRALTQYLEKEREDREIIWITNFDTDEIGLKKKL